MAVRFYKEVRELDGDFKRKETFASSNVVSPQEYI